jgi:alpha-glucuronidase
MLKCPNWTGFNLAQPTVRFGVFRESALSPEEITDEWVRMTI